VKVGTGEDSERAPREFVGCSDVAIGERQFAPQFKLISIFQPLPCTTRPRSDRSRVGEMDHFQRGEEKLGRMVGKSS
jgi:hypothetical protein